VLLQYSHPVFVAALAPMLLNERPGPGHWPLVLSGFAGLAVAIGVGARVERAALIALCGAFLSGIAYMTVRRISATEAPLTIVFWFALVMLPGSAIGAALPFSPLDLLARAIGSTAGGAATTGAAAAGATLHDTTAASAAAPLPSSFSAAHHLLPATTSEWLGYLGVVLAGLLGQITLTEGLARAGAARAVAVTMSGPLFGLLFDLLFFGLRPTLHAAIGTVVVVVALCLLGWLKPVAAITEGEAE
jgi:drug/metabolite transporter (DMT)-like permease